MCYNKGTKQTPNENRNEDKKGMKQQNNGNIELTRGERLILSGVLKIHIRKSESFIKENPNDFNAFFVKDELPTLKALLKKIEI